MHANSLIVMLLISLPFAVATAEGQRNEALLKQQYDAFVSYSSHDREWVKVFVRNLQRCGVKVWWDRGEIRPGESWVARINEGLAQSKNLLLIMSPASMASSWVIVVAGEFPRDFAGLSCCGAF